MKKYNKIVKVNEWYDAFNKLKKVF